MSEMTLYEILEYLWFLIGATTMPNYVSVILHLFVLFCVLVIVCIGPIVLYLLFRFIRQITFGKRGYHG